MKRKKARRKTKVAKQWQTRPELNKNAESVQKTRNAQMTWKPARTKKQKVCKKTAEREKVATQPGQRGGNSKNGVAEKERTTPEDAEQAKR